MTSIICVDCFLAFFYTFVAGYYTVLIKRRARTNSGSQIVNVGQKYTLHWWNHLTFRVMRILIWLICLSRVPFPQIDHWIGVLSLVHSDSFRFAGMLIIGLGFCLTISSNLSLQNEWRSGIDQNASGQLKKTGLYAISRNPGYVGVTLGQIGFFFALPSFFTIFCLVVGWISLNVQIKLEEEYLRDRFGAEYEGYKKRVPRWFGVPFRRYFRTPLKHGF